MTGVQTCALPIFLVACIVDTAAAPRIAAKQAPAREQGPLEETELLVRVDGVLGAGRVVLALPYPEEGREREPVSPDCCDSYVSHAAAFVSTSSTRSASQSKPFAVTASESPGLAIST